MVNEAKLKVMPVFDRDKNKFSVRLDPKIMKKLGINSGDVIEITGNKTTVAKVEKAYRGEDDKEIIRMDEIRKKNAKTRIGDTVNVKKIDVKEAEEIIIAPEKKGISIKADSILFKRALLGNVFVKDDLVIPGGPKTRRRTMSESPFFDDIFSEIFEESLSVGFGLGGLRFIVVDLKPKNKPVIVTEDTKLILNPINANMDNADRFEFKNRNKIIRIKKLPNLKLYKEVLSLDELQKAAKDFALYSYRDKNYTYYFANDFYFKVKKKK